MMLPSSISAPSTLVPMISAVSGSSTENPNVPSTCEGQGRDGGWETLSATVNKIRISAGIANRNARFRPRVERMVIQAIVGLKKPDIRFAAPR
jgi:hypothetical protein